MKTGILDRAVFAYLLRDAMRVASRCHARLMAGKPLGVVPSPAGPDDSPDVCFYVPGRACRRDPDSGIEMENAGSVVYARV